MLEHQVVLRAGIQLLVEFTIVVVVSGKHAAFLHHLSEMVHLLAAFLADGTVVSWGSGGGDAPAWLTNVVAIAAGSSHDLALDMDGTIIPWGLDNSGVTMVPILSSDVGHQMLPL